MSFHYSVTEYDFHTYFDLENPAEVAFAHEFKTSIEKEFHEELQTNRCVLKITHLQSIGPHPDGYGMFESDTACPETFLRLLNFYQTRHGKLSVLIHPHTSKGDLIDHTTHALWLGGEVPLKLEILTD